VDTTSSDDAPRLSIGEVARLAGVTPRTLRHYHATCLLAEPSRDSSGYRRYGAADLIALVRVVRLRALGMPIPQIVSCIQEGADETSLPMQLRALAEELDHEIVRLTATRDRLRELAATQTLDRPAETLVQALRAHGLLGDHDTLPEAEHPAAALLDALHPQGMPAVLDQAGGLLADPAARSALAPLLQRFQGLTDASPDAVIGSLAGEVAAVLPRPEHASRPVDLAVMPKLLGDRLNAGQLRFMRQLRGLLDPR
jgi:DNA-binding transcriptional MerR regulator